jgi:hypothetical protein
LAWSVPKQRYVLRDDWRPAEAEVMTLEYFLLCSARLWEEVIGARKLRSLRGYRMKFQDHATDGWPDTYEAFRAEVERRGLVNR